MLCHTNRVWAYFSITDDLQRVPIQPWQQETIVTLGAQVAIVSYISFPHEMNGGHVHVC